jgi:hypothetical protein
MVRCDWARFGWTQIDNMVTNSHRRDEIIAVIWEIIESSDSQDLGFRVSNTSSKMIRA